MQDAVGIDDDEPIVDLDHDHDDLTALLQDLSALVQQASVDATRERALQEARHLLRYFSEDMATHFELEEERLFPSLKAELPDRTPVIDALARAHERFTRLVNEIHEELYDDSVSKEVLNKCQQNIARLIESFRSHSRTESELVRAMDAAVRDPDRREELREHLERL